MQKAREKEERRGRGEEEPAMGLPLPVPLLQICDISEAAGAPKQVKKKWQPVGSQGTGDPGGRGSREADVREGTGRKEIKKAPRACSPPPEA